jgi:hypothetical protein
MIVWLLSQRFNFLGLLILSGQFPIGQELILMQGSPFDDESERPRRNTPFQNLQGSNVNGDLLPAVLRMEMRRVVLIEKDGNDNTIETAYFRHRAFPFSSSSLYTVFFYYFRTMQINKKRTVVSAWGGSTMRDSGGPGTSCPGKGLLPLRGIRQAVRTGLAAGPSDSAPAGSFRRST